MLILAADTSGKNGSLAIARFDDSGAQDTLDVVPIEGGTFSAQLIPQIASLLERHRLSKKDINGFAIVSGPGSFTGLRVGLAAIKALAEILHNPIAAVSLLEAVARMPGARANEQGTLIVVLDAGRGEVYSGEFQITPDGMTPSGEKLHTLPEFIAHAGGKRLVTSDRNVAESLLKKNLQVTVVPRPAADLIARLGYEKIRANQVAAPETLDALYIRRSDAEIKSRS